MSEITRLITATQQGDLQAAGQLLPLVYDELRKLAAARMARETPGQTLQATALVHEAYLRVVDDDPQRPWNGRGHFFAAAAEAMRRILIERARHRHTRKAGGDLRRQDFPDIEPAIPTPDDELLALDAAIDRLDHLDPRKAQLVKLRFFTGLTIDEAADALGVSPSTANNDWAFARSWLRLELQGGNR